MNKIIDLRSDTVSLPTDEMREAIYRAELGDDVYGEDPTVNALESKAAQIFGMESAVLVASGTMGNLVASLTHCERGDEMIVGQLSHINRGEGGGPSVIGGISIKALEENESGLLDPDQVKSSIHPDNFHYPRTAMIAIENTHKQTKI